jgi:hypothetical protein
MVSTRPVSASQSSSGRKRPAGMLPRYHRFGSINTAAMNNGNQYLNRRDHTGSVRTVLLTCRALQIQYSTNRTQQALSRVVIENGIFGP